MTFSMGPKSGSATPSPRKPRTTKKTGVDEEITVPPGAFGGGGARGRGRPRKTVGNMSTSTSKEANVVEPASKKIKTEDGPSPAPSPAPAFEIQIPASPSPVPFPLKREDDSSGLDTLRKVKHEHAPDSDSMDNDRTLKQSTHHDTKVKIEETEAYAHCGREVNCAGTGCGQPRCSSCWGDWDGEM